MSKQTFEKPIGFHLIKVKGAVKTGADAYRAVLAHNDLALTDTPFNPSCFAHLSLKTTRGRVSILLRVV